MIRLIAIATLAVCGASSAGAQVSADARFMHNMITHHGQALTMADMVPARTGRPDMRLLAERITVSQKDEIAFMQRWLLERQAADPCGAPDEPVTHSQHHAMPGADSAAHHALMPGMLTDAELAQLASANGQAFDTLFLQFMIRHHEGAIAMVKELFAVRGAGEQPAIFRFASEVDTDQRTEITRMQTLLRDMK